MGVPRVESNPLYFWGRWLLVLPAAYVMYLFQWLPLMAYGRGWNVITTVRWWLFSWLGPGLSVWAGGSTAPAGQHATVVVLAILHILIAWVNYLGSVFRTLGGRCAQAQPWVILVGAGITTVTVIWIERKAR